MKLLLPRFALWLGCATLAAGFVAAEDWVAGSASVGLPWAGAAGRGVIDSEEADRPPSHPTSSLIASVLVIDETALGGPAASRMRPPQQPAAGAKPDFRPRKFQRIHRVTAYCDRGTTSAGVPSGVGQCAAPADIPLGSKVYIPALGRTFVVTDRTHRRFRHNTVDIFVPGKEACREFGRRYLNCEFTITGPPPAYGRLQTRDGG